MCEQGTTVLGYELNKIKHIKIELKYLEYLGGIDFEGHERRDNYAEKPIEIDFYFYYDEKTNELLNLTCFETNECDEFVPAKYAVKAIVCALCKIKGCSEYNVTVDLTDGTSEYVDAERVREDINTDKNYI